MRVATIDIGTNTVLLLVAERSGDGAFEAVCERATITRLGEGVDRSRSLSEAAVARTAACLDEYADVVHELGVQRVAVVGTSAMRDASGGEPLHGLVRARLGVDIRVVSGEEEARLTFRGALSGLRVDAIEDVAVFDIGGGSTEVVVGRAAAGSPRIAYAKSFDVGSVRLTERHVTHDPPTEAEIDRLRRAARAAFAMVPPLPSGRPPVGIAGTMTTLAAVALGLEPYDAARVHGYAMSKGDLDAVVARLASTDLASRRVIRGMEPKRADVIVAGGILAQSLLELWQANAVVVSDRGVRWGLAEELT